MKTTITGFIHYRESGIGGAEYKFFPFEMTTTGFTIVMPYSFDVEIPDDFDPRTEQVKTLRAEKIKLMLYAAPQEPVNAQDQQDAQRYRYLRDSKTLDQWIWDALEHTEGDEYTRGLDASIDAAIAKAEGAP